jgi:hypothetical protein
MNSVFGNREEWLNQMVEKLRPHFDKCGYPLPEKVRVSIGFSSTSPLKTLGECWHKEAAPDQVSQIFITPTYGDGVEAAGTLMHELLHAALPSGATHKKPFKKGMKAIGLEGPPKSAGPNAASKAMLSGFIDEIGTFPHVPLQPRNQVKKQPTRMLKLFCPANNHHSDDFIVRTTKKMLDIGHPVCPCGKKLLLG